jgi:16S rRNA processing protein RimM
VTSPERPRQRPEDIPDDYVIVGEVVGAFGLRGALRVRLDTSFPERLVPGRQFVIDGRSFRLRDARLSGMMATLMLEEVEDRTAAEALRGAWLLTPKADLPSLPAGEFYIHQLVGLRVQTREGEPLGILTDVLATGANDVYVVTTPHGPLYLPAIEEVIVEVDVANGVMVAEPIEGSLPTPPPKRTRRQPKRRRTSSAPRPAS